jgi:hypothetical protein
MLVLLHGRHDEVKLDMFPVSTSLEATRLRLCLTDITQFLKDGSAGHQPYQGEQTHDDEGLLHTEDGIAVQVLVAFGVQCGR